ncbi:MAG: sigma-54 dependent transcriptional regulator [Saprospiraceae bacterium]|nr:sigma-54 dependent transcriptional regulator [Saprospiraceae bacterium]MCF8249875.1 sigma-54 dependent transcriptional regulator [Saprospiraceae bacterium]MCF8279455.1 sigma-54 dependent transcriptional regulator [Bacteroidales bacterium]MCF8311691.1 sigma-54 dependent transcriptional regulator [Saprospiraceae bacterium]MCF8440258.1 sigma-54 dependent transcriptional regulator [Saprospiraceae bacterium]
MKANILIIDDENDIRNLLSRIIRLEGYEVFQAETGAKGLKLLQQEKIHAIICDVKLPDANGVEMVSKIKAISPQCEVILLTAYGAIPDSVTAIKAGAFDYITKGDDNNKIIPLLSMAVEKAMRQFEAKEMAATANGQRHSFGKIVGQSKPMQHAIEMARKVAATSTTVLLTGETGTGKEVFAQAIHGASNRNAKSFVAINCSALGKELLESEMFGHKTGSFTGAVKDKIGLFEEANGGTIFLDEIGEMDIILQAKLLRVLETGTFMKVGETKETKVDVRIIAATNRDLQAESDKGNFRLDLFYRLSVFNIRLPSLAERQSDILVLAEYFIKMFCAKMSHTPLGMDDSFKKALTNHPWKGNIRELKNIIERSVILASGPEMTLDCLPYDFQYTESGNQLDLMKLAEIEKMHIRKVLAHTKGNKTKTAELLGIGLATLYRKIEEYGFGA